MLTRLSVLIILQYVQILNHCVVHPETNVICPLYPNLKKAWYLNINISRISSYYQINDQHYLTTNLILTRKTIAGFICILKLKNPCIHCYGIARKIFYLVGEIIAVILYRNVIILIIYVEANASLVNIINWYY